MFRSFAVVVLTLASACTTMSGPVPNTQPLIAPTSATINEPNASAVTDAVIDDTPGDEISNNSFLLDLAKWMRDPEDAKVSLAINELTDDRVQESCTKFVSDPATAQRVSKLLNFKEVLRGARATLNIVPIKPVGPMSVLAEARRVERDLHSGGLAARIAAERVELQKGRAELQGLQDDALLACGPLFSGVGVLFRVIR